MLVRLAGLGRCTGRRDRPRLAGDDQAEAVGEHQAVRRDRVPTADPEQPMVVGPVAAAAQGDEVLVVGGAAEQPVHDVVDVEVVARTAPRHAAGVVAVQDEAAQALGHDALGAADGGRAGIGGEHRAEQAVAREVVADDVGQRGAVRPRRRHRRARVEEQVDPEALAAGRCLGTDGSLGEVEEGVDPRDAGGRRVLAQPVPGRPQGGVDDAAVVGAQVGVQVVAAVVARPGGDGVGGLGCARLFRVGGRGHDRQGAADDGPQLVDGGHGCHLGDPMVVAGIDLDGDGGLVDREPALGEKRGQLGVRGRGIGETDQGARPFVGDAGLPCQPVGQRADAEAGPGAGVAGLGHELDELGVEGVELPDDDGEAVLSSSAAAAALIGAIVRTFRVENATRVDPTSTPVRFREGDGSAHVGDAHPLRTVRRPAAPTGRCRRSARRRGSRGRRRRSRSGGRLAGVGRVVGHGVERVAHLDPGVARAVAEEVAGHVPGRDPPDRHMAIMTWAMSWHTPRPSAHASGAVVRTPVSLELVRHRVVDGSPMVRAAREPIVAGRWIRSAAAARERPSTVVRAVRRRARCRHGRRRRGCCDVRWSTALTPTENRSGTSAARTSTTRLPKRSKRCRTGRAVGTSAWTRWMIRCWSPWRRGGGRRTGGGTR